MPGLGSLCSRAGLGVHGRRTGPRSAPRDGIGGLNSRDGWRRGRHERGPIDRGPACRPCDGGAQRLFDPAGRGQRGHFGGHTVRWHVCLGTRYVDGGQRAASETGRCSAGQCAGGLTPRDAGDSGTGRRECYWCCSSCTRNSFSPISTR